MEKITPQQIIEKWPSKRELAADVSKHYGRPLEKVAVNRWHSRGSIPAKYDRAIVIAASLRGLSVTVFDLMAARSGHNDQLGNGGATLQGAKSQDAPQEAAT